jgi:DNA repair/transcription protein MET18/MMS19
MLRLYDDPLTVTSRSYIINSLTSIMESQRHVSWSSESDQHIATGTKDVSPLEEYKATMLGLFISGLRSDAVKESSLEALHKLMLLNILSTDDYRIAAGNLTQLMVQAYSEEDDISLEILSVIDGLAKLLPTLIEEITLPALFRILPEVPPSRSDRQGQLMCTNVFAALETLCVQSDLFSRLVIHLCTKFEFLIATRYENTSNQDEIEAAVAFGHVMLKTLHHIFDKKLEAFDPDIAKYVDRFLPRLYGLFFHAALDDSGSYSIGLDTRLIATVAEMVPVIIASLGVE